MSSNGSSAKKNEDPGAILDAFMTPTGGGATGRPGADKENADQRWIDALEINAKKVGRLEVRWRRGNSPYELIEGLQFNVPAYDESADGEKEPRNESIPQWAKSIGDALWHRAWTWATENHTQYIDAQVIGSEWSESKGRYVEIKGFKCAAKMEFSSGHSTALDIAAGGDPQTALIVYLVGAMERKEERDRKRDEVTDKVFEAAGRSITQSMAMADKAISRMDTMSADERADRKESRDLLARIVQTDAISKNVTHVITELAPGLNDLFKAWGSPGVGKGYTELATELLASITKDQIDACNKAGIGDIVEDLQKILTRLAADVPDEEKDAIIQSFAKIILGKQETLGPLLTQKQRSLAMAILKKGGLAD